jgi:hypothetical protein
MALADLIAQNSVLPALKANSKKQLLQELAAKASEVTGLAEREVFDVILQRERLGSTGVGNGIAIPHGKLPSLGPYCRRVRDGWISRWILKRSGRSASRSGVPAAGAGRSGRRSPQGAFPHSPRDARQRDGGKAARHRQRSLALRVSCRRARIQRRLRRWSISPCQCRQTVFNSSSAAR